MTMSLTDLFIGTVATANFLACHYSDSFLKRISNSDYPKSASKQMKTKVGKRLADFIFSQGKLRFNDFEDLVSSWPWFHNLGPPLHWKHLVRRSGPGRQGSAALEIPIHYWQLYTRNFSIFDASHAKQMLIVQDRIYQKKEFIYKRMTHSLWVIDDEVYYWGHLNQLFVNVWSLNWFWFWTWAWNWSIKILLFFLWEWSWFHDSWNSYLSTKTFWS